MHYCAQLIKSNRHRTLLEVNLLRKSQPQHILSPLSDCLDVDEVLNTNVFGYGVTAP